MGRLERGEKRDGEGMEGGDRQMGGGESKSLLAHADLTPDDVRSGFRVYFQVGVATTLAWSKTLSQQLECRLSP